MRRSGHGRDEDLRRVEKRLSTIIERSPLGIHVFTPDGRSLLANGAWDELWNLREGEEPEGTNIFEDEQLRAAGLIPYVEQGIAGGPVTTPPLLYEPARAGREGVRRWMQAVVYPVQDEAGRVSEVTLILEDVTERKVLEERLSYQAFHDDLTGLPNRALFVDRLENALDRTRRVGTGVAVLFMDLDNFKHVNDSLGYGAGDLLLCAVAGRVGRCSRPGDTVARLGGDEFAVLLEDLAGAKEGIEIAEEIAGRLRAPFVLDGREVFVTTSIGIAPNGPGDPGAERAEDLLRDADIALYAAKEDGKDRCRVFEPGMKRRSVERLSLESDLRRAIEREEFVVHYQPKVELATGRTVGMEALLRWRHPERGLVPPADFIPLAEETGMIIPIGRWVLAEACRQARWWQEEYPDGASLAISVNLSPRQFRKPALAEDVARVLAETGLEPSSLELEITESALMEGAEPALRALKALGVRIAVDDFGTGYSSLSRLKYLPVDSLKIDRSFVDGLGRDPRDGVLVSGMVELASGLGLGVVAEGVETAEQLERLLEMGCGSAQGYYFARPLAKEAASDLLTAQPQQA